MNVGHVKGPGGIEPTPQRPQAKADGSEPALGRVTDEASISSASREALAAAEALTARARQETLREDRVEAARERLERGELDSAEALRGAAERLLGLDDGLSEF